MYPIIHLFGFAVQSYYVCAATAGVAAVVISAFSLRKRVKGVSCVLLPLFLSLAAIVGARVLNVFTNPGAYGDSFSPWSFSYTKLSLMGGLIVSAAAARIYAAVIREDSGALLDSFVIAAAAGIVILKIGCFLNGCCFGKPSEFGVVFPSNEAKYNFLNSLPIIRATSPRVHPTQLYEAFGSAAALALSLILEKTLHLRPGGRFCVFAAGFSAVRLAVLPFRALPYPRAVTVFFYPCLYTAIILLCVFLLLHANVKRFARRQRKK